MSGRRSLRASARHVFVSQTQYPPKKINAWWTRHLSPTIREAAKHSITFSKTQRKCTVTVFVYPPPRPPPQGKMENYVLRLQASA